jgi:PD-(D/E)XK endonuclease
MDLAKIHGTMSELRVAQEYVSRGYAVSFPITPERYDFIAEMDGITVRVQVKHATPFNGGTEFVGFSRKPYTRREIDIIAMYDTEDDTVYYIPVAHVEGMQSIRLRREPYKFKTDGKALIAEHYTKFI